MQRMCQAVSRCVARLSARIAAPATIVEAPAAARCAILADGGALLLARVLSTSGPTLLAAWRRGADEGGAVWLTATARVAHRLVPDALLLAAAALLFAVATPRARANPVALAVTAWSRWVVVLLAEALWNAARGGEPLGAAHRAVQAAALFAAAASSVGIVRALRGSPRPSPRTGRSAGALFATALGALVVVQIVRAAPILMAPRGPTRGAPAPDFAVSLLDGGTFHLAAARGRPVLIDFWATWCDTCVESMPSLGALYERERGKLDVVAIEVEGARGEAARLAARGGWAVPMGLGDAALAARYGVRVLPHLVLVDARGRVALVFRGAYEEAAVERALGDLEP